MSSEGPPAVPPSTTGEPDGPSDLAAAVRKWKQAKRHFNSLSERQRSAYAALRRAEDALMDIWAHGDQKKL